MAALEPFSRVRKAAERHGALNGQAAALPVKLAELCEEEQQDLSSGVEARASEGGGIDSHSRAARRGRGVKFKGPPLLPPLLPPSSALTSSGLLSCLWCRLKMYSTIVSSA